MQKNSLNLCFFWHMHQPDYRSSAHHGMMQMPWVFLHAIKDYYEMLWLLQKFPTLKASFNITSPLIEQLHLYKEPLKNDYFLSLWHKTPDTLTQEEREWLIKTIKSTQYETMIAPIPYFAYLYNKEYLEESEFVDFEVVFMLAWCGNALREQNAVVKRLFTQEKGFNAEDKTELLESLCVFTQTILPLYAKLQNEGIISVATTPYNHPILPLLLDMNNALKANPHTTLVENPLSLKEDAAEQIERAIHLYKESFGVAPKGFWPAEGAVCEESLALYKEYGLEWVASDEAILFKSLEQTQREHLYKPYDFKGVGIGFRDHTLSDLIGFTYRFKSAQNASEHFIQSLEGIAKTQEDATVFVILDGENAWEFFSNNAYEFFMALYSTLEATPWCKTLTMDATTELKNRATLKNLSPGSWIHANFDTWSGHSEKNRAWELIYQTKRDFERHGIELNAEQHKEIKFHFLASECSDWFWWYGDDHSTEFSAEFDTLFRGHLLAIYEIMGVNAPMELFVPIITHKSEASFFLKPQCAITPIIDGKVSSFFEWLGAGVIDESRLYSTMDRVRGPIEKIHYGQDATHIYLAFEGDNAALHDAKLLLEVSVEETKESFSFRLGSEFLSKDVKLVCAERIELSLAKSLCKSQSNVHLRFEILKESKIIQSMPGYGALLINTDEDYAANWFV